VASGSAEPATYVVSDPATPASYVPPHHMCRQILSILLRKKGRKRHKRKDYVACQTNRVVDKIYTQDRLYHVAGEPMLLWDKYLTLPGDCKSLHDLILEEERRLICMESPTYPLFVAKVPKGLDFVDKHPAELFFLRFEDIFSMFHMSRLHPNFVRLFTLAEAY
jgi:hypothetical protein